MKLEEGKYYKTRSGHKALIYKWWSQTPDKSLIHGAVFIDGVPHVAVWSSSGDIGVGHDWNLIFEWKETKKTKKITVKAWWDDFALFWCNGPQNSLRYKRVPSEDKVIEVEDE